MKYISFFATTFVRTGFATVNIYRLETEMFAERRVDLYLSDVKDNQRVDKLSSHSPILSLTKIKKHFSSYHVQKGGGGRTDMTELIARICYFSFRNYKKKVIHVPKPQAIQIYGGYWLSSRILNIYKCRRRELESSYWFFFRTFRQIENECRWTPNAAWTLWWESRPSYKADRTINLTTDHNEVVKRSPLY